MWPLKDDRSFPFEAYAVRGEHTYLDVCALNTRGHRKLWTLIQIRKCWLSGFYCCYWHFLVVFFFNKFSVPGQWVIRLLDPFLLPADCCRPPEHHHHCRGGSSHNSWPHIHCFVFSSYLRVEQPKATQVWNWGFVLSPPGRGMRE